MEIKPLKVQTMLRITRTLLTALIFCISFSLSAQMDKAQADREAQQLLNQYQADLELNVEQVTDFHGIISKYLMKRDEVENMNIPADEKKTKLAELSKKETTEMTNLLYSDQIKKYRELKPKLQPI